MSNQRPAKIVKPLNDDGVITLKELINFSKNAAESLEKNGEPDAAFYFEQLYDWLKQNPHKGLNENCDKILGL